MSSVEGLELALLYFVRAFCKLLPRLRFHRRKKEIVGNHRRRFVVGIFVSQLRQNPELRPWHLGMTNSLVMLERLK